VAERRRFSTHADGTPRIDITKAHPARVYDYWLGGKDNFAPDREIGDQIIEALPGIIPGVRAQRAFLGRAVRYLATQARVTQFLDIGTGLPAAGNTHEVAQRAAPQSRIVYVDNDPMVLAHARALLTSSREGACAYIEADLREVKEILAEAEATLDFGRPVAVVLLGVMQFVGDKDSPSTIIDSLLAACPPGSYLVLGQPASDVEPERMGDVVARAQRLTSIEANMRTRGEVLAFFDGLELVPPGVVQLPDWRPEPDDPEVPGPVPFWCGVARRP
jgi:trans-aconitate methyltransferase